MILDPNRGHSRRRPTADQARAHRPVRHDGSRRRVPSFDEMWRAVGILMQ